jgi:predicted cupin superfamily sugar epimerase
MMNQLEPKNTRAELIIHKLELLPHPEGGYFKETYRSSGTIPTESFVAGVKSDRNYSTSIYFLLTSGSFSAFHRIPQDEIWHFYDGSPLHLHSISPNGEYTQTVIGKNIGLDEIPQFVVPGGYWFGATVMNDDDYSLVGCTVAPGFDFLDFELGLREKLLSKFPQHHQIINRLTRS